MADRLATWVWVGAAALACVAVVNVAIVYLESRTARCDWGAATGITGIAYFVYRQWQRTAGIASP